MDHTVLPANYTMPAFTSSVFTSVQIAAYFSFVDPERMKGWVGLVGWPTADGLPK